MICTMTVWANTSSQLFLVPFFLIAYIKFWRCSNVLIFLVFWCEFCSSGAFLWESLLLLSVRWSLRMLTSASEADGGGRWEIGRQRDSKKSLTLIHYQTVSWCASPGRQKLIFNGLTNRARQIFSVDISVARSAEADTDQTLPHRHTQTHDPPEGISVQINWRKHRSSYSLLPKAAFQNSLAEFCECISCL